MTADAHERLLATDPSRSFIVQAPAGSGKTELLTQRFLRLLSTVQKPEQIVALTFTRKAASEMRNRIITALKQVASGVQPTSPHQAQTFAYAKAALDCDTRHNWQLLNQAHRLSIMTIDALCQKLTHAIPLTEKALPYTSVMENPSVAYQQAARACLMHAFTEPTLQPAISTLLEHLDNRQDTLITLFSSLLATREQWLKILFDARIYDKTFHERALSQIETHAIQRLIETTPVLLQESLCRLSRTLACLETDPHSPRAPLAAWQAFETMDRIYGGALGHLLLTKDNHGLRQRFDHHVGLRKGMCEERIYQTLKKDSEHLLTALRDIPDFLHALVRVKTLPKPQYDPREWELLSALFTLLPFLTAHLHLIFSEYNQVDFASIALEASRALGEEDNPTDLALYLDNQIHHLLVDEFQDTSITQMHLLEKMLQGFEPDSGKTCFVVGDPMQSIYRFRQAEVGLFLKAKLYGIGSVTLIPLELSCNFRSTATIIDWINRQFPAIFPAIDDIESGAVSFHPSIPVHPPTSDSNIVAQKAGDAREEAAMLLTWIEHEQTHYPDDTLAILVQKRSQLTDIVRLLRAENIPFQGVEIDKLSRLPLLGDLWSLTQALLYPADRLHWLTVLRSPFCGLTLADLVIIANIDRKKSLLSALGSLNTLPGLSEDGKQRAHYFYTVMHQALATRGQYALVDWIIITARHLHLDNLMDPAAQADLEPFYHLLERESKDGQLVDKVAFQHAFNQLYAQQTTPARLQIMTIHKAKGLEFDAVMLPGLSAKSPAADKPLLRWLQLPTEGSGDLLLVSPLHSTAFSDSGVYSYLGCMQAEKEAYELQRRLYVAATRAKKRLYLFDKREKENTGSFRALLSAIDFTAYESSEALPPTEDTPLPVLYQLPLSCYNTVAQHIITSNPISPLRNEGTEQRQFGTLAHELLQWACTFHPNTINELPWSLVSYRLKQYGWAACDSTAAESKLRDQLNAFFNDPRGQWILQKHQDEKNEYELFIQREHKTLTRILDRTFIEQAPNGIAYRWIIDFKTGEKDNTQGTHTQQLNEYAYYMAQQTPHPIQCGLYYLSSNHWETWGYTKE